MRILDQQAIEKLSTRNRLAYYKKVRLAYFNTRLDSEEDFYESEFYKLQTLKNLVKAELDKREHVEREGTGVNINNKTRDRND